MVEQTSSPVSAEFLKQLLLDLPQERQCDAIMNLVVRRLSERPSVALTRIWLIKPGDICKTCARRDECPTRVPCLHLAASEGQSKQDPELRWARTDGSFSRFPLGKRKVGYVAAEGKGLLISDLNKYDQRWVAEPDWVKSEEIRGFIGQPIIYQGEVLGVLATFLRRQGDTEVSDWLRLIADHLAVAIANARAFEEIERLQEELKLHNTYLQEEVLEAKAFGEIVGQSPALNAVYQQVDLVAPTDASVLILGESGTGKELIAREIHARSSRKSRPLIKVNCASVPRELYESEFFGHVRGSFTGAIRDRVGRFALADHGTLFLDEVGEIPMDLQSKLLRVLQEGEYERLGDERTRKVDVRIVAATNRDLKKEVEAGRFRQDLYYRLNVFPVEMAPLRDRKEDIAPLAIHFLKLASVKLNLPAPRLTQGNVVTLQDYSWPGNVRELQNVIERALIVCKKKTLRFDSLEAQAARIPVPVAPPEDGAREILTEKQMRARERDNILAALEQTGWKIYGEQGTAALLGIKPTTLSSRIKTFGLKKP